MKPLRRKKFVSPLEQIPFDPDGPIPDSMASRIREATERVQAFQDARRRPIEQFVACDYELAYLALQEITERRLALGRRCCEWGAGFGVVASLASSLGWDVVGIEAEAELIEEARRMAAWFGEPVELVQGDFLPAGAERLADDSTYPSLGHPVASAYDKIGLDLDDFDLVFVYPWPQERNFIETVFDRYAARGALMLMFCGPYEVRLLRKRR